MKYFISSLFYNNNIVIAISSIIFKHYHGKRLSIFNHLFSNRIRLHKKYSSVHTAANWVLY